VYLDNILIFSKNPNDHNNHVRQVLQRLREWKLYAKVTKYTFDIESVDFLGFVVIPAGIVIDQSRVTTIQEWPVPTYYRDIQVFLGFANFYRRFIYNYSKITAPLNAVLKGYQKDHRMKYKWTEAAEITFGELRAAFLTAPILAYFDPAQPITVLIDASDFAIAAILLQPNGTNTDIERHPRPVVFWLKKFNATESRYEVHNKELMVIVFALQY